MQGFKILIALCVLVGLAAARDGKLTFPKPQKKNICSNKEDGVFLPVAGSCSKYVICYQGKTLEKDCGEYHFNSKILVCDVPERAGCSVQSYAKSTTPSKVVTDKDVIIPYPTLPTCYAVANGIRLPVPGNPRQYYICMNNKAFLKDCGNLYFVAKYSACAVRQDSSDSSNTVTPTKAPSNQNGGESSVCYGKPDGARIPVAENSRQYHICMNDKSFLKDCGNKMLFDTKYSVCTLASSKPEEPIRPAEELEQTDAFKEVAQKMCANRIFGERISFPGYCSLYIVCTINSGFVKTCGWREFNSKTASCDLPQNVKCEYNNQQQQTTAKLPEIQPTSRPSVGTLSDRICLNQKDGVFIASPGVCSEFFFCLKQKGYRKNCGKDRHFNPKSMICVDLKYSKCIDIFPLKKSERAIIPRAVDDSSCINKQSGTLLNSSESCGKFIICDNGVARQMDCPAGLHFNSVDNICDWPTNVQCSRNNGLNVLESTQNSESISPSQLPTIINNTSSEKDSTSEEDEKPAEDLNNLASIIIGEILKGISKSTKNKTVESSDSDEDKKLNSDEILIFEPEITNNDEIEKFGVDNSSDEEITISEKDIEGDDDSKEEEDSKESTENSNELTTLIISQILDEFSKPRITRNASNDEDESLTSDDLVDNDDDVDENKPEEEVETEDNSELASPLENLDDEESSQKDDEIVSNIEEFSRKDGSQVETEPLTEYELIEEEDFDNNNEEGTESLLLAICVIGAVTCSHSARIKISSIKSQRELMGNECKGHPHGDLIPYPGDCGKYLVCEYFNGTVMSCPGGLHFNPVLKVCDYPTSAGCNEGGNPVEPSTEPTLPTSSTEPPTEPTEPTPPTTPSPTTEPPTEPTIPTPPSPSSEPPTEPTPPSPPTEPPTEAPTSPSTEPTSQPSTEPPTDPSTETTTHSSEFPTTTETAPTLSPNENVCDGKENGALAPFPYDCNWYIRCEDNSPLVKRCAEGKLFNAILLICDYPENFNCIATPYPTTSTTEAPTEPPTEPVTTVDPTPTPTEPALDYCIDQPNDTLLEYPCDCTWYIRCVNNGGHYERCKDGRVFNSVLQICDFPENTDCKNGTRPSTSTSTTEPSAEVQPTTTTLSPVQGSTNPPYVGTGICENIERGTFLPYPGRCDLYIECIEPAPTTFSCPSGMEFNPEVRQCQKLEEAGCSIPRVTPSEAVTTTESTKPSPPILSGICSSVPPGDLIPYPGNCSQFINCDKPIPTAEECPIGLEFNARLKLCELSQDAGCSSSPEHPPNTPATPTTPPTPSGGPAVCEGRDDGELVAYPEDCRKFIICQQPIPSAGQCANELIFNAELGICDEPTDTECVPSTLPPHTESPSDPTLTGICKGHQAGDLIAYPSSCTKYVRCITPVPIAGTCRDDQLFNEILGICDTADSVNCPGYIPSPTPEPGQGTTTEPPVSTNGVCQDHNTGDLLPYPEQCSKFIQCATPVPYAKTCSNGFHFNAKLSICDDPETAGCEDAIISTTPASPSGSNICCGVENGTLVPYPEDCTQYIRCDYPIPAALQCDNGLHFNSVSQKCESIENASCQWYKPMCEGEDDGTVFPYSEDCKQYYFCSEGAAILLPCTIGAIFDSTVGKCVPGDACP
ncbi:uncharacterized protein LOC129951734 [Eupeodes corollae]|uniref:uncharacterized protein LOC129951734 n=1 Tax=Eupeodes corollae TaxID=290404 RepID=UPI0024916595|nr:uncharacterized protein LOC129951734 [Eupeodes corollae]